MHIDRNGAESLMGSHVDESGYCAEPPALAASSTPEAAG